jgi:poly-gamma-glutamate synthesis protein (capsule biosynthesis protein)
VPAFGAGVAATAYQPWVTQVRGTRIAVLGLEHVAELWERWSATETRPGLAMARDTARLDAAVAAARAQTDVLVAFLHWGAEYDGCPTAEMSALARKLVDAGVDLIVGSHAHRLQGAGWLGNSYVAYGLGNFLWWRNDASSNDTGVLEVTVRENRIVRAGLRPAMIDRVTGQPMPASAADSERILAEQEELRACAGLRARRSVN